MNEQTNTTPGGAPENEAFPMDASTRFSFERTLLSHDRTLMSWIRTATSLITFGFTIYKFFQFEQGQALRPGTRAIVSPRTFAVFMIAIGLCALVLATVQNAQYRRHWRKLHLEVPLSMASLVAALIAGLGLLAMAVAIFRW